jgi:hypothetical protein
MALFNFPFEAQITHATEYDHRVSCFPKVIGISIEAGLAAATNSRGLRRAE